MGRCVVGTIVRGSQQEGGGVKVEAAGEPREFERAPSADLDSPANVDWNIRWKEESVQLLSNMDV